MQIVRNRRRTNRLSRRTVAEHKRLYEMDATRDGYIIFASLLRATTPTFGIVEDRRAHVNKSSDLEPTTAILCRQRRSMNCSIVLELWKGDST